jgi:hypothetical protein
MEQPRLNNVAFSSRPIERVLVLRAHGGLASDGRFAAAFTEQVALARAEGYTRVIVDMDCPVNAAGLEECPRQEREFRTTGGRMAFFSSRGLGSIHKLIKSYRFFFDSEPEALVYVLYEAGLSPRDRRQKR